MGLLLSRPVFQRYIMKRLALILLMLGMIAGAAIPQMTPTFTGKLYNRAWYQSVPETWASYLMQLNVGGVTVLQIDVDGNLTTVGTVDGVDVSAISTNYAPLANPALTGTVTIGATVNLYNAEGILKTDDTFYAGGSLYVDGNCRIGDNDSEVHLIQGTLESDNTDGNLEIGSPIVMQEGDTVDGVDISTIPTTYAPINEPVFTGTQFTSGRAKVVSPAVTLLPAKWVSLTDNLASDYTTPAFVIQPNSDNQAIVLDIQRQTGTSLLKVDKYGFIYPGRGFSFERNGAEGVGTFIFTNFVKAADAWVMGQPVYMTGTANTVALADADAEGTCNAIGIMRSASTNTEAYVVTFGPFRQTNWSGALDTGSTTLTIGATYYVSGTAGKLTATRPVAGGTFRKAVGVAISTTTLLVNCGSDYTAN
jgi:hypothetical protein